MKVQAKAHHLPTVTKMIGQLKNLNGSIAQTITALNIAQKTITQKRKCRAMTYTETQPNHQDTNITIMNMAITIKTINLRINTQIMELIIFSRILIIRLSIRIFSIRLQAKKM
jgi:hypothetical protein